VVILIAAVRQKDTTDHGRTGNPFSGTSAEPGGSQIEAQDIEWANLILVMEKGHSEYIKENWRETFEARKNEIVILGIDDEYFDSYGKMHLRNSVFPQKVYPILMERLKFFHKLRRQERRFEIVSGGYIYLRKT